MQYNAKINLSNGDGAIKEYDAKIEFICNPNQYGNGYTMVISSAMEPWGEQGYDIRYDKGFSKNYPIEYIVSFYSRRFNGENGAWKLTGISVCEAVG